MLGVSGSSEQERQDVSLGSAHCCGDPRKIRTRGKHQLLIRGPQGITLGGTAEGKGAAGRDSRGQGRPLKGDDYWANIGVSALGIPGEGRISLEEGPASAKSPR